MKNRFQKTAASVLALLLLCGTFFPCLARAAGEAVPMISVPGFMATDLYIDKDDPSQGLAWPLQTDSILNAVKESLPALARYALDRNADRLCDVLIPKVNALFEPAELDANGEPKGNSGVIFEYPAEVRPGESYTFRYDWRLDPVKIAAELHDFVEYILEKSGSDKVSIECHSLGGLITLTYITLYGNEKLKNVVFNSTAVFGESFNGGLLSGKLHLTGDAVVKYMRYAFNDNEWEDLLNGLFELLGSAGLMDLVCDSGNRLVEAISPRAVPECVAPLFAGWLTIWGMIPDEFIEDALAYIFETVYPDDSHSGLRAKIDRFNENVRPFKVSTLRALNEAANVFVLARYGWSSIPVTPYYNRQSDGSIDLQYASFGATCAEYGETLPEEYLASADAAYLSPDRSFDASTCLFPEQTWFIRDLPHGNHPAAVNDFLNALLRADRQETVDTLEGYSRFMVYSGGDLQADPGPAAKPSFFDRLKAIFGQLFAWIGNLFRR